MDLNMLVDEVWDKFDRVTIFAPDHGYHPEGKNGTHGTDSPEDMIVNHFYRLRQLEPTRIQRLVMECFGITNADS